jgi:transcriptional regulator with XRE-family HTH domain
MAASKPQNVDQWQAPFLANRGVPFLRPHCTLPEMPKQQRPSEMKEQAGRRLKAARLALDVDRQDVFAAALGVTATAYGNYEKGDRLPDAAMLVRLLALSGIGPDWVYAGSLAGVPYELATTLRAKAAEVGAVVGGPVAEWPMAAAAKALPRPAAAVPALPRTPRRATLHEPPPGPATKN